MAAINILNGVGHITGTILGKESLGSFRTIRAGIPFLSITSGRIIVLSLVTYYRREGRRELLTVEARFRF